MAKYASGFFSLLTNHVCKPNIPGQKAAIELKKLLNDAKTSNTSTREIVTNSLSELDEGTEESNYLNIFTYKAS